MNRYFTIFKVTTIPNEYMSNDTSKQAVANCIDHIISTANDQSEIDEIYANICDVYYKEMKTWLRSKNVNPSAKHRWRHSSKPFWDENLNDLWNQLCQAESTYLAEKGIARRRQLKQIFKNCQRCFDKYYRKQKRQYNRNKCMEIESLRTSDPKEFWSQVRKLGPRSEKGIPMSVRLPDGSITSNIDEVLSKWEEDYKNLYNPNIESLNFDEAFKEDILRQKQMLETQSNSLYLELDSEISRSEVEKVVNKLKKGKSVGVEGIPYEVLKNFMSVDMLHCFFNKILNAGLIPGVWRCAIVKPIPKGSMTDPMIPSQYRGISLLSTIYKIYSGVLNNRLLNCLESQNIYAEEQNGFRPKRSCNEHVYSLTTVIRHQIQAKKPVFACFIDAEKAFDRVDRDFVLFKLLKLGIRGKLYNSVKNIYNECYNCVDVNGNITNWFSADVGVKQGDGLSPTLFGIYVNDIITEISEMDVGIEIGDRKMSILAYADDIVVLGKSEEELQNILDVVGNWGKKWRMKFNCAKSNVIHFRKHSVPRTNFAFNLGGYEIDIVDNYKYLGVPMNENLDYSFTANKFASAGSRALGSIVNKYKKLNGLGYYTYTKLYNSCVCPVLDYCSEVWGYKDFSKINSVQNRALRVYLGVHQRTSNLMINGDMGWTSCQTRRYIAMVRFYNRLLAMDDNRIAKRVFLWEKDLRTHGWAHEIKSLFEKIGQLHLFDSNRKCNINRVWAELFDLSSLKWKHDVQNSAKLRTYVNFKHEFGTDPYVYKILNRGFRSVVSKFRSGTLPLEIEVGRWRGTPLEERICKLCDLGNIEDEAHFLLECTLYSTNRQNFFNRVNQRNPSFEQKNSQEKISILMSPEFIVETSKFLFECLTIRNETMYNLI